MVLNGNRQTLYLVCDISGSMGENGKAMIMRGISRAAEQFIRFGYADCDMKLILWNSEATYCDWNQENEFPDMQCCGSANASALCNLLGTINNGKILLLTDGWWSKNDSMTLRKWKNSLPTDTLRIIKIGGDANPLLKGNDVFLTDDFLIALDSWLQTAESSTSNGDDDEW